MSFTIKADFREVNQWINNQPNRNLAKKQALVHSKNELVNQVTHHAGMVQATGELKDSVVGKVSGDGVQIYSVHYGDMALEYGRGPGGMPPYDEIAKWARIKLGTDEGAIVQAIRKKISDIGTDLYNGGGIERLSKINDDFAKFLDKELLNLAKAYTE